MEELDILRCQAEEIALILKNNQLTPANFKSYILDKALIILEEGELLDEIKKAIKVKKEIKSLEKQEKFRNEIIKKLYI